MRLLAIFVAMCALSQTAAAQSPDCKSIPDPGPRLACYDKATPPVASSVPGGTAKPAPATTASRAPVTKIDNSKYVDTISQEDALMNARLKNICKGC